MKITRQSLVLLALLTAAAAAGWGQVTLTLPEITDDTLREDTNKAVSKYQTTVNDIVKQYTNQPKLARGVANAGSASVHLGAQRSWIDYRKWAVTLGGGLGASLPGLELAALTGAASTLARDKDIYAGAAVQVGGTLGLSLGVFRENLDKWYVALKFGMLNLPRNSILKGLRLSVNSFSIGALVNYHIIDTFNIPSGVLRWRGLSLGSGLIYQSSKVSYDLNLTLSPRSFRSKKGETYRLYFDPKLTLMAQSNSLVIPLEVNTGLRILWLLDISFGAGIDISMGSSSVGLNIDSPLKLTDSRGNRPAEVQGDGTVNVNAGTTGKGPTVFRPRLSSAVGLNLGPLKLEVPVMLYFEPGGNTLTAGLNLGILW